MESQFLKLSDLFPITIGQARFLYKHYQLLEKWNEYSGLVAPSQIGEPILAHYADSLEIALFAHSKVINNSMCDIGSGGGFPGMITAIIFPNMRFTLFERSQKKRNFLKTCVIEMDLQNIEIKEEFQEFSPPCLITARAVSPLNELFELINGKINLKSQLLASLGPSQLNYTESASFIEVDKKEYCLPESSELRTLILFVPRET